MNYWKEERKKIKICGITSLEDARFASGALADYLGFIFYKESKRFIEPAKAGAMINWLEGPETVGVFVEEPLESMNEIARMSGVDWVQLHGNESPEYCRMAEKPVIKVIHVREGMTARDLEQVAEPYFEVAQMLLFDTAGEREWGGTGRSFEWSLLAATDWPLPIIVAGGIGPGNLERAFRESGAQVVDLSSSVESSPGVKDFDKLTEVMDGMRAFWEEE